MTAMKIHYPIRRRTGTSISEFSHYWITYHAELAKSFALIRGMTQCLALPDRPAVLGEPLGQQWCDGAAEMWVDGEESLAKLSDDAGFAALIADEDNFIEPGRRFFIKTEEVVLDECGFDRWRRGVKVTIFARRSEGTSRADLVSSWTEPDAADRGRALGATRHVVCPNLTPEVAVEPAGDEAPYDAVRELWWPDRAAMEAAAGSRPHDWSTLMHASVIDAPRSFAMLSHERVVLPVV